MGDRFPFPDYPTGWYRVAFADELGPGELVSRSYFGRQLLVFRSEGGAVHVLDAHCPHLGAHIGIGGRVDGACVVCPFHGWRFDAAGRNVEIPYRPETNQRARLRAYPAREWCGMVMAWFDEGEAPAAWQLPHLPELDDAAFRWHAPEEARWRIRTHPQEILENAVDIAHFRFVHGVSSFGEQVSDQDGPRLRSTAELTLTTPRGPVAGAVVNELWGLGVDINRVVGIGDACTVLTTTPVDGEVVDAAYAFLSPRSIDGEAISRFGQGHVRDTIQQIEADLPIWEHKVHRATPSLAVGEGAILAFRRWAAQFYPVPTGP